jgi:hypothetical protein
VFRIFQTLLWPKVSLGNEECASNVRCNIDMGAYATHCLKNAIKGLHIASDGFTASGIDGGRTAKIY